MEIRFVSRNQCKIDETIEIMKGSNVDIIPYKKAIEELQTSDVQKLVKDKLMKAFSQIGRPLFVEHTGLYIKYLNNFPAGLTQIFWDSLEADKFAQIIGKLPDSTVCAKTIIGYCDGKKIHYFNGKINGKIVDAPRGDKSFQWDCVFVPDGQTMTFAEMGKQKNVISMRKKALDKMKNFLSE